MTSPIVPVTFRKPCWFFSLICLVLSNGLLGSSVVLAQFEFRLNPAGITLEDGVQNRLSNQETVNDENGDLIAEIGPGGVVFGIKRATNLGAAHRQGETVVSPGQSGQSGERNSVSLTDTSMHAQHQQISGTAAIVHVQNGGYSDGATATASVFAAGIVVQSFGDVRSTNPNVFP